MSPSLLLASFIMILVLPGQLPNYLGFCLFILGPGASIMYYSVANWRPCTFFPFSFPCDLCSIHSIRTTSHPKGLIMSHIEHSPSPTAIPGATSACRQMTALNALSVINLFSGKLLLLHDDNPDIVRLHDAFYLLLALVFMYEVAGMKLRASDSAQVNPNNDEPQEDNEVNLRDMAHHLDALDNA
ncbi:hypothetical protein GALMADRAFT_227665 [Galerina marginata CBS 339.88]|uniref:Uncharacterized protein n=1 Tax=Galerina marginata (strain CBS 339.88) TaxID=685588 RepID=A0A067T4N5_GALM3|nr:hypothetical protein GALMADRAFT_227665 [Galerina marginata CBS 339.88]